MLSFRDWKTSLELSGGATMARGVVHRSGRLDLTKADRKELVKAGITDIIDLRTTWVARRSPDPAIKGARYRHVKIFGSTPPAVRTRSRRATTPGRPRPGSLWVPNCWR